MKDTERRRIVRGINCCLGVDERRCEGCPFKRYHGRDDGKCLERLLKAVRDEFLADLTEEKA